MLGSMLSPDPASEYESEGALHRASESEGALHRASISNLPLSFRLSFVHSTP